MIENSPSSSEVLEFVKRDIGEMVFRVEAIYNVRISWVEVVIDSVGTYKMRYPSVKPIISTTPHHTVSYSGSSESEKPGPPAISISEIPQINRGTEIT